MQVDHHERCHGNRQVTHLGAGRAICYCPAIPFLTYYRDPLGVALASRCAAFDLHVGVLARWLLPGQPGGWWHTRWLWMQGLRLIPGTRARTMPRQECGPSVRDAAWSGSIALCASVREQEEH